MLIVAAVVFVDTMFYAAIAPLLPTLAKGLHLSKLSAGVMTASYPIGTLVSAISGGVLAVRAGPKVTVWSGLTLLAASTLAFGFLDNVVALDAARFVEGVGGACSWAGGLAWIIGGTPRSRRGQLIGTALGAAIAGALFGPVIGTLAAAVGRAAAFSGVVVFAVALIAAAARLEAPSPSAAQGARDLRIVLGDARLVAGMWLVALPAVVSGLINVLGPLRLHRVGASALAIGAVFLCATAVEAVVSPAVGRWSDRSGRLVPIRFGLALSAALLVTFTLPRSILPLGVVIVLIASLAGAFWAPAMALLSDRSESRGLEQGLAAALMNLAWAVGQVIGSGGGGAVAKVAGDGVPMLGCCGLCLLTLATLATVARWRSPPRRTQSAQTG